MTIEEIKEKIITDPAYEFLRTNSHLGDNICLLYLSGSYAYGTNVEDSDIDLLIEKGKPMSLLKLSGFRQDVEEKMKRSVDVVTTTGIEAEFATAISGTEILLYEE